MSKSCFNCINRMTDDDNKTMMNSNDTKCICGFGISSKTDCCCLYRCDTDNPQVVSEIIEIIKQNPIIFCEDVLLTRKLNIFERQAVESFIKKHHKLLNK